MNTQLKQFKDIKSMLDLLNESFPSPKDIPSKIMNADVSVNPAPIFTANYSEKIQGWWINITDYNVWHNDDFKRLRGQLRIIAKQTGLSLSFCYVWYATINSIKDDCRRRHEMFIGKVNSEIIYI
jgi:hypothetical protein